MKKTKMLKKNYEFKKVLTKGNYYAGKGIEAFILPMKEEKNNKLGIAISVKIGKAVTRNKLKRLFRESYRNLEENCKTGYEIVFLWKRKIDVKQATYQNIKSDMKAILEKAKLFEGEK